MENNRKRKLLALGDSNTYGFDPRAYIGDRYPETVRWTGRLQQNDREVVNYGQNGIHVPHEEAELRAMTALAASVPDADAADWGISICFDGMHPDEAGHAAFAGHLEKVLEEMEKTE